MSIYRPRRRELAPHSRTRAAFANSRLECALVCYRTTARRIYDRNDQRMLEVGNAELVQLESRRLFWSILLQGRQPQPVIPAAKTFMQAQTVVAV